MGELSMSMPKSVRSKVGMSRILLTIAILLAIIATGTVGSTVSDSSLELVSPFSLLEMSESQLKAIDVEKVINQHLLPEHVEAARESIASANKFEGMTSAEEQQQIDASLAEIAAADSEGRPVDTSVSVLLQTEAEAEAESGAAVAGDYWSNANNRRNWCNAVRWGYWTVEKNPQWQRVCKGIEKFRPWGWWSHFCHNIHKGSWGKWYRQNHWWQKHCDSIKNPHYTAGSKRPWIWHPQHKRHQHSDWCEKNGHKYRDLNNAHYNHWCYGREAPKGYRRGFWDVDPKASAKEQANYWFCKAYKGYDKSWKLNNKFKQYQKKCLKGEGARGARHPTFNPKMSRAEKRAIKKAARAAAKKAKAKASRPQWRWSKKVPRTKDSDWCEANGLKESSSHRYARFCEGNRESDKERQHRIKRAVRRAKKAVLRRIPHRHHMRRGGKRTPQQKAARRAQRKLRRKARKAKRKAKKAAKRAKRKAARKAKRAARKAARKAKWAKMSSERRRRAKAKWAAGKAARKARRAARKAKRRARKAAKRAKRKARRRAKKLARKLRKGKRKGRHGKKKSKAQRKYKKLTKKFGKAFADKWRAARKARKGAKGKRAAHKPVKKVKQIKLTKFVKNPLVIKAQAKAKLDKIKSKLTPKQKAAIKRKMAKTQQNLKKSLPKGVKKENLSEMMKALKLAATLSAAKGNKKANKGQGKKKSQLPMPPNPKLPPRPKTAPKMSTLKKVEKKLREAELAKKLSVKKAKRRAARKAGKSRKVRQTRRRRRNVRKTRKSTRSRRRDSDSDRSESRAPARHVRDTRDDRFDEKGFKGFQPDLTGLDKPAAEPAKPAPAKPSIEEIWAKEDAERRLARQKRLEKEDAEDRAEVKRLQRARRLRQLKSQKAKEDAKKPVPREFQKGENKNWDVKFPSSLPPTPKPKKFTAPYAPADSTGCPTCKKRTMRKKWQIVLDPTSVSEIDLPLIEELHRRVDYLIEPQASSMSVKEENLRSAARQVIEAEDHHIRVYDFELKHKDQLLVPEHIQEEQKFVQLE